MPFTHAHRLATRSDWKRRDVRGDNINDRMEAFKENIDETDRKLELCTACKEPIDDHFISLDGNRYHDACFFQHDCEHNNCQVCNSQWEEAEKILDDTSEDYPIGGSVEPYDIEIEKELTQ